MRLTELEPRWLEYEGRKVGILLRCPHCRSTWLSCMFERFPVLNRGEEPNQYAIFKAALGDDDAADDVVPCSRAAKWSRTSDDFATMTIDPSLDASASGHWHGQIIDGDVI
jgi:hypothetical protein